MPRILIILLESILLFALFIVGVFANEPDVSISEKAAQSIETDVSGTTSGDPSSIAIESIKNTAETYPNSPAAVAAKNISPVLSGALTKESTSLSESLVKFSAYLSIFFLSLSLLGFITVSFFLKGDEEKTKMNKLYIRNISIGLMISFILCLILYFVIPLFLN